MLRLVAGSWSLIAGYWLFIGTGYRIVAFSVGRALQTSEWIDESWLSAGPRTEGWGDRRS